MRIIGKHIHYGTYGSQYQVDENGNETCLKKVEVVKRGRGRPKKMDITPGNQFSVSPALYRAFGLL